MPTLDHPIRPQPDKTPSTAIQDEEIPDISAAFHHVQEMQQTLKNPRSDSHTKNRVLQLQRVMGNRFVQKMLQAETVPDAQEATALPETTPRLPVEARLPSQEHTAISAARLGQPVSINQKSHSGRIHRKGEPAANDDSTGNIWEESNKDSKYRTGMSPGKMGEQFAESSEAFRDLKAQSDTEVKKAYGEDRPGMEHLPQGGSAPKGTSAGFYYQGRTYFNMKDFHPAVTAVNLAFETAHGVQAVRFVQLEKDYNTGVLTDAPLTNYIPEDELPAKAVKMAGDSPEKKRAMINEYYEWCSLQIAKPALRDALAKIPEPSNDKEVDKVGSFRFLVDVATFEEYLENGGYGHYRIVLGQIEAVKRQLESV